MKSIKIDFYKFSIVLILTGLLIVAFRFTTNNLDNGRFVLQPKIVDDDSRQAILDSRTGVIYQLKRKCLDCSTSYEMEKVSEPLPK